MFDAEWLPSLSEGEKDSRRPLEFSVIACILCMILT